MQRRLVARGRLDVLSPKGFSGEAPKIASSGLDFIFNSAYKTASRYNVYLNLRKTCKTEAAKTSSKDRKSVV